MTIDDVMTTSEAAERWGVAIDNIKKACVGQKV